MQHTNVLKRLAVLQQHLRPEGEFLQGSPISLNDTCGIIGVIGAKEKSVTSYLIEGLKILESRGYDSAGMVTVDPATGELITSKCASRNTTSDAIDRLAENCPKHHGQIGLAHTRWATHGARTDLNAHPHQDHYDRIAVVHNGVIENADALKKELAEHGIKFKSETDTEVIAQLIGHYLHTDSGLSTIDAVNKALNRMEGTWGLVVVDKTAPNQMILAKNGSPLIIGVGQGQMFVASEPSAFGQYTKEFIALEDGETAIITSDSHSLDRSRIELAPYEKIEVSPAPWPHWTIKEIFEQPEALARALNYGGRFRDEMSVKLGGLDANLNILKGVKHLVIAACGTSYYSGLAGAQYMRLLNAFDTVQVIDAAEVAPQNLPSANGALLVISQSGETKDVHRALQMALDNDMPSLSIVNVVGSLIARTTHCGVYLNAGREHAVASTKAFTSSCTVLAMIAVWFAQIGEASDVQKRRGAIDALHRLPTNVGMTLRVRDQCKTIAKHLVNEQHIFILGKGHALPIAMEGALKIKEISYIHAEGYPGGALKHGPFALITDGTPIILIILNDRHAGLMQVVAEEVKSRGAKTIVITDLHTMRNDTADFVIKIPSNGVLTNILAVIPLQLIAYETSVLKGIDPDRPKNLAKAVTVD